MWTGNVRKFLATCCEQERGSAHTLTNRKTIELYRVHVSDHQHQSYIACFASVFTFPTADSPEVVMLARATFQWVAGRGPEGEAAAPASYQEEQA